MPAALPWTTEDEAAAKRANEASDPWSTCVRMEFCAHNLPPVRRYALPLLGDHYWNRGKALPWMAVRRARGSTSVVELAMREGQRLGLLDADGRSI